MAITHTKRVKPEIYNSEQITATTARVHETSNGTDFVADELNLARKLNATSIDASANDILTFAIADQVGASTINATAYTVALVMPFGTDLTDLTATFTLSAGATASPTSPITNGDFSSPVTITVTAEYNDAQVWTVTVTEAAE